MPSGRWGTAQPCGLELFEISPKRGESEKHAIWQLRRDVSFRILYAVSMIGQDHVTRHLPYTVHAS